MSLTLDGTTGASQIQDGTVTTDKIANDAVTTAKIGNSQVTDAKVAGIAASKITSGTVAVARLGSGTPGSGNFLRGDGSWQAVPASVPTTAQVLDATAGASVGAVGTYALLWDSVNRTNNQGQTRAGSELIYANNSGDISDTGRSITAPSGTWQVMGVTGYVNGSANSSDAYRISVWLRIS
jgi:hypothetical protein